MEVKLFELRTQITSTTLFAFKLDSKNARDRGIIRHSGYKEDAYTVSDNLIMGSLEYPERTSYASYEFATYDFQYAFNYIKDNWNRLNSGSLIDVDYLIGNSPEQCETNIKALPLIDKIDNSVVPDSEIDEASI